MQQAIENRGGEHLIVEDGAPLCHDLIAGDERAAPEKPCAPVGR
jgi:hypothetical protein